MIEINLLPYQKQVVLSDKQIRAIIGGTGTGKTYLLPRWLYIAMLQFPGEEWIVSSPTIPMLKRNPIKYILNFLQEEKITHDYNKTEMVLRLPWGTVYFISAVDADRMQGIHPKGIFGDEAGLFPVAWWETALQRIAYRGGFIGLLTTPYALNWLKTEVWDKWLEGDPDIELRNPTSWDNPFYPRENIQKAKERLPDWKFRMRFEGQFTKPEGLIYPTYEVVDSFEIPPDWDIFIGMDTGYNNPTAIIWIAADPETETFYIFNEWKHSKKLPDDIVKALQGYEDRIIYADPENAELLAILRKKGLRIRKAKKDVLAGITHVQGLFENRKLKVFSSCVKTIDELNSYMWDTDKTGEFIDKPAKYNDHLMDALRYALFTYEGTGKIEVRWI